jgi:hypothetical protein
MRVYQSRYDESFSGGIFKHRLAVSYSEPRDHEIMDIDNHEVFLSPIEDNDEITQRLSSKRSRKRKAASLNGEE